MVSPSSRPRDYMKKMLKYAAAGVREYWIAYHEKNRILVYNFEQDAMEEYTFSDQVAAGIFEDFAVDFSGIELG